MKSEHESRSKQIVYGFLIDGATEKQISDFKMHLANANAINFKKNEESIEIVPIGKIKHQLKTSSIKVIAIGHGYDNGTINNKYKIIDVVKDAGQELGDCASRVSEFRLQVCNQAKFAIKTDDEGKEKLDPTLVEALKSYKSEHIIFCCPKKFSYIKGGGHQDTNADSMNDYKNKSELKELKDGKDFTLSKDVVLNKEKGKVI